MSFVTCNQRASRQTQSLLSPDKGLFPGVDWSDTILTLYVDRDDISVAHQINEPLPGSQLMVSISHVGSPDWQVRDETVTLISLGMMN